ncbi:hypothetical protein EVAR_34009_1 [Eumeta japonica]|uniref:Uncharacterized protein n=1 Tax=Eumeta variegata TaxID=151549 RepID=A0A4C1VTC6_EUMVA|nr:hypothetical protein EVAR_34009_1 [Eumeta japonica]
MRSTNAAVYEPGGNDARIGPPSCSVYARKCFVTRRCQSMVSLVQNELTGSRKGKTWCCTFSMKSNNSLEIRILKNVTRDCGRGRKEFELNLTSHKEDSRSAARAAAAEPRAGVAHADFTGGSLFTIRQTNKFTYYFLVTIRFSNTAYTNSVPFSEARVSKKSSHRFGCIFDARKEERTRNNGTNICHARRQWALLTEAIFKLAKYTKDDNRRIRRFVEGIRIMYENGMKKPVDPERLGFYHLHAIARKIKSASAI